MEKRKKKINWLDITRADVIKAIEIFFAENPEYPFPKNTFLIYKGNKLPAKHIRGMAYKVAYGNKISKSDFGGGMETVRFFERLGFEMAYKGKSEYRKTKSIIKQKQALEAEEELKKLLNSELKKDKIIKKYSKEGLKIGLYLQTDELENEKDFKKAIEFVKKSDVDIFVLPEFCYVPFHHLLHNSDILSMEDFDKIYDACLEFSKDIGKAVIVSSVDKYSTIFSVFANAFADESETQATIYVKHTATFYSAFDLENYKDLSKSIFGGIIYKGYRIGMTICYDCNHSLFSRVYGLMDIDIIINSTGGDVVYDKWYKYNKVRAIENSCYNFVTMGGNGNVKNPRGYVFGFNPEGKELKPINLIKEKT